MAELLPADVVESAWSVLDAGRMHLRGAPIGLCASVEDTADDGLNYRECFTRDFAVAAAALLGRGDHEIVRGFLTTLRSLQAHDHDIDCVRPSPGLMPASFRIDAAENGERVVADYGQRAIARVTPVDAALWWLLVLRAYQRAAGDRALTREPETIEAIERILRLYLAPRFEMVPTLLVPDGAGMIDRRMGVYGHPLDVQALFFAALRAARELLPSDHAMQPAVLRRLGQLGWHVRWSYWLDEERLGALYRFGVEQFGDSASNRFNIYPDTIPTWAMRWLQRGGGYFAGNLGPARMDFRFFALGNLLAVAGGLATEEQGRALFALVEAHQEDLLGVVPMKLVHPALENDAWRMVTGADPKNRAWSYHNGGSWPFLMWSLAQAGRRVGDVDWLRDAVARGAERLRRDDWPEYYDGPLGGLVGRYARLRQTWSAAGVLAAGQLLDDPSSPDAFAFESDAELEAHIRDSASPGSAPEPS
ncbi:MAG: glycoside hydrolase 100 family protein [Trueperaceae bacterium]|nr:glycoside hydrolase 100 family protein [Trueperaceae bacterium]